MPRYFEVCNFCGARFADSNLFTCPECGDSYYGFSVEDAEEDTEDTPDVTESK